MKADFLQAPAVQYFGWALVHFLWQGVLLAVVGKGLLIGLRRHSAQARYWAACALLCSLALAPVLTSWHLVQTGRTAPPVSPEPVAPRRTQVASSDRPVRDMIVVEAAAVKRKSPVGIEHWLEVRLHWLLLAWATGVLLLSGRMAFGWHQVKRFTRSGQAMADAGWEDRLLRIARRLGVTRPVRLLQSALIEVPTALGWLRPVILLPIGCLTGLSPEQLEAILAHELAHIRRHDYLVNLVQNVVETLLFYHPAVWWVSQQIRMEREHCCDDLAIVMCPDRIAYARALASLEERRSSSGQWALAASGQPLLERIRRLSCQPVPSRSTGGWLVGLLLLAGLAAGAMAGRHSLLAQASPAPILATTNTFSSEPAPAVASPGPGGISLIQQSSQETDEKPGGLSAAPAPSPAAMPAVPEDAKGPASPATDEKNAANAANPSTLPPLFARVFKVSLHAFEPDRVKAAVGQRMTSELETVLANSASNTVRHASEIAGPFFRAFGVDIGNANVMPPSLSAAPDPNQKALFLNARTGLLLARATLADLDRMESAVQRLNSDPPQVSIETRFAEMDASEFKALDLEIGPAPKPSDLPLTITNWNGVITNSLAFEPNQHFQTFFDSKPQFLPGKARVLTPAQTQMLLAKLVKKLMPGPRVVTLSGRQAQVSVIELKSIVLLETLGDPDDAPSEEIVTKTAPLGPTVDLFPFVLADDRTIQLSATASWTEFLGYDDPGPGLLDSKAFGKPSPVRPLPRFRVRQGGLAAAIPDGHTLVAVGFGPPPDQVRPPRQDPSRQLIMLLTPTLVDSTGHQVHEE
jgi:beta-lactamase regulating signal transducer with metallopeptidase domain